MYIGPVLIGRLMAHIITQVIDTRTYYTQIKLELLSLLKQIFCNKANTTTNLCMDSWLYGPGNLTLWRKSSRLQTATGWSVLHTHKIWGTATFDWVLFLVEVNNKQSKLLPLNAHRAKYTSHDERYYKITVSHGIIQNRMLQIRHSCNADSTAELYNSNVALWNK